MEGGNEVMLITSMCSFLFLVMDNAKVIATIVASLIVAVKDEGVNLPGNTKNTNVVSEPGKSYAMQAIDYNAMQITNLVVQAQNHPHIASTRPINLLLFKRHLVAPLH